MNNQQHPHNQQHYHNHQQQQQHQRRRLQCLPQQQQQQQQKQPKRCSEIFKNSKSHKNRKDILTFLKSNYKYKRRCRSSDIYALPVRHRKCCQWTKHCCKEEAQQNKSQKEKKRLNSMNLRTVDVLIVDDDDDVDTQAAAAAADNLNVDGVGNDDVNDDSDETSCQRNYDKLSTLVPQTHQQRRQLKQRLQHQKHQQPQQQQQPNDWLQRLCNEMSQRINCEPNRRQPRMMTSAVGESLFSSLRSDRRTQVMPIFMTLFIALSLSGRCVEAGACWQKTLANGKCNEIFSLNISKDECCNSNQGFSFTDRDLSSVEYFFATTIGGGMECAPCLESCRNVKCGPNKKCVKRKGRPKCICAPECGAAARKHERRRKVFLAGAPQEPHHQMQHLPNNNQQPQYRQHFHPLHSSGQTHQFETATVMVGKSARDIRSLSSESHSQNLEFEDALLAAARRRWSNGGASAASERRSSTSQRKLISVVQSQTRERDSNNQKKTTIAGAVEMDATTTTTTTARRLQVISNVNNNNSKNKRKKSDAERMHKQDQLQIKTRTLHKKKKKTMTMTTTETATIESEERKKNKKKDKSRKEELMMKEMKVMKGEMGEDGRGSTTTTTTTNTLQASFQRNSNNNNNNDDDDDDELHQTKNCETKNNTKLRRIHSTARQRFHDAPNRDHQQQQHSLRKRKKKKKKQKQDQNADTNPTTAAATLTALSGSERGTATATAVITSRRRQKPSTTKTKPTKMSFTPSTARSSASEADQQRLLNRGSSFATSSYAESSGSMAAAATTTTALSSSSSSLALPSSSLSRGRSSASWSPSSSATAATAADVPATDSGTGNSSNNNRSLIDFSDDLTFDDRIIEKFNLHGFPNQQYQFTQHDRIHHSSHHQHHHHHQPVCGTDGRTYNTECQLKKRACRTDNPDLVVAYHGHCKTTCNGVKCLNGLTCVEDHYAIPHCIACRIDCPLDDGDNETNGYKINNNNRAVDGAVEIDPSRAVCGVDGRTYRSVCDINRMICKIGRSIGVAYPGPCRDDRVSCSDISCGPKRTCLMDLLTHEPRCISCRYKCARKQRPTSLRYEEGKICGVNRRTYNSWCEMRKDSCATGFFIDIRSLGECQD